MFGRKFNSLSQRAFYLLWIVSLCKVRVAVVRVGLPAAALEQLASSRNHLPQNKYIGLSTATYKKLVHIVRINDDDDTVLVSLGNSPAPAL